MPSTFTDISTSEEKATEFKANAGQFNVDEALGIVECFVAGIGNKDSVGDVCLPGSFVGSLKRRKPRVVWGHNWNEPIGKVLDIYEVGPNDPRLPSKMRSAGIGGLYARVQFNLKSERGKEAFNSVVFFGEEQEWSIGYKTLDAVFDPSQQANLLKEVELYEVSPVLHGANQLTGTISIKSDKPLKDPDGGLTAAGRAHFKRTEGANLKPGVKGPADTPEKMRRKGSFLTRFYTNPSGPLVDDDGEPTRLALAAAAWGEPVPKNRQDAAELAAKGRRMLERYGKSKKKSANDGDYSDNSKNIYESPGVASNTTMGRVAELAKALSTRFSAPVKVRTADRDMVVFDINNGGQSVTMRATYYFDGDEFMFGEPHQVRAETVYIPANSPSGAVAGHAFGHDHDDDDEGEYAHEYREMLRDVQKKPHGDCGCGCAGAGTCGTSPKPMTWGMFKERNPGAHLFIRAMGQEKSEAFDMVNEVCEYHGLDVKELDDGIAVPFIDSISEDGYNAIMTIAENMSDSFDAKSVGGKLRRIGRTAGNMMDRFDPNARDADGDRTVQEGTRFARPAKPGTPRMMPKVKPIQVPRPEEVPIKPPVPSTPTPAPTKVPDKPKVPQRAGRLSGSMGLSDNSLHWSVRDFTNPGPSELSKEMDKVLETVDGDSAWEAWSEIYNKLGGMLDDMKLDELEDALDEMKAKFRQWGTAMQGEYNDTLAERLSWGDEEGVIKHLMRWEDMTKRQAQKEAPRLIAEYEAASQKEHAFEELIQSLKDRIREIEREEDALTGDDYYE
jgi:HK97 family phage prohead protease